MLLLTLMKLFRPEVISCALSLPNKAWQIGSSTKATMEAIAAGAVETVLYLSRKSLIRSKLAVETMIPSSKSSLFRRLCLREARTAFQEVCSDLKDERWDSRACPP